MSTITMKVYLTAHHFSWHKPGDVYYSIGSIEQELGGSALGCWPHEITLPLPEDFNVHTAQVAALEAEKAKAIADYQATVASINERLGKLQALTNEVQA